MPSYICYCGQSGLLMKVCAISTLSFLIFHLDAENSKELKDFKALKLRHPGSLNHHMIVNDPSQKHQQWTNNPSIMDFLNT